MSLRDYKLWEKAANDFIHFVRKMERNGDGDYLRKNLLIPSMKDAMGDISGKKVLDAGCGEGVLTEILEDLGGEVVGVDSSKMMIQGAEGRKEKKGMKSTFVLGSVTDKLFETESFDVIVLNMLLQEIEDADLSFKMLNSYLKPGGKIVISVLHPAFDMNSSQAKALEDIDGRIEDRAIMTFELPSPYSVETRYERQYTFSEHPVPYYFRSISHYVNLFIESNIKITYFKEPTLSIDKVKTPNQKHAYLLPRFLIMGGEKL